MAPKSKLRFKTGTDVLCRTGQDTWEKGRIVALNYRESDWPPDKVAPYQVSLDDGRLIFVPLDDSNLCKKFVIPAWHQAVTEQNVQKLKAVISSDGCEGTDHLGRTPLLSCIDIGWQAGALLLLTQRADPCACAGPEKLAAIHRAVLPLARVSFQDEDKDRVIFSRDEGVINAVLEKNDPSGDDIEDPGVTSISYNELEGMLTWIADPDEGESYSSLCAPERAWVPGRIATMVQGTKVKTDGLPKAETRMPLVKALLEARADVNVQNEDPENDLENFTSTTYTGLEQTQHRSALHYAAEAGEMGLCARLIAARAVIDLEDRFKMTPLDLAAEEGSLLVAEVLLRSAADPNRGNMRRGLQQTLVHDMANSCNAKMIEILVKYGGNVNAIGKQGLAPLHLAARKKHVESVKVLLESRADIALPDKSGRIPGQYAMTNRSAELGKALALDDSLQLSDRLALLRKDEKDKSLLES